MICLDRTEQALLKCVQDPQSMYESGNKVSDFYLLPAEFQS